MRALTATMDFFFFKEKYETGKLTKMHPRLCVKLDLIFAFNIGRYSGFTASTYNFVLSNYFSKRSSSADWSAGGEKTLNLFYSPLIVMRHAAHKKPRMCFFLDFARIQILHHTHTSTLYFLSVCSSSPTIVTVHPRVRLKCRCRSSRFVFCC